MMLSKRPMRFFTSPLLVPCCAHAKAGGLLRSRTVSGAIQQGCARVFDPKKDGAARLVRSSAREPEGGLDCPPSNRGRVYDRLGGDMARRELLIETLRQRLFS